MTRAPTDDPAPPSRRGLTELLLLFGFLALAAAGVVAVFGDELRQALGAAPAAAASARDPARVR